MVAFDGVPGEKSGQNEIKFQAYIHVSSDQRHKEFTTSVTNKKQ